MNDPTPPPAPAPAEVVVPSRAIIQIAVGSHNDRDYLYALANDGTVWRLSIKLGEQWMLMPALPATVQTTPAAVPVG